MLWNCFRDLPSHPRLERIDAPNFPCQVPLLFWNCGCPEGGKDWDFRDPRLTLSRSSLVPLQHHLLDCLAHIAPRRHVLNRVTRRPVSYGGRPRVLTHCHDRSHQRSQSKRQSTPKGLRVPADSLLLRRRDDLVYREIHKPASGAG